MKRSLLSVVYAGACLCHMGAQLAAAPEEPMPLKSEEEVKKEEMRDLAALKNEMASAWTSVTVAFRYECSCTGSNRLGFKVSRGADGGLTVAPWASRGSGERADTPRILHLKESQELINEIIRVYDIAISSVHAIERIPPRPENMPDHESWLRGYLSLAGVSGPEDDFWMEVRVINEEGSRLYVNMVKDHDTGEVCRLALRFGQLD